MVAAIVYGPMLDPGVSDGLVLLKVTTAIKAARWNPRQDGIDIAWTKYIPHKPHPKQLAALWLDKIVALEALYGGAAGGGKSDYLLMGALQYVDKPGYSALLLRRTYTDLALPEALMDRAHQWLDGTDAVWRDSAKTWRFPAGATLSFGYLERDQDKYRYQSAAFQYIGFDELTQFRESMYTYMFSRLRRLTNVDVPLRMRSASNPGNIGHEWVRQRFITEGAAKGRAYLPATLSDNPSLDREEYTRSLSELDPVTRQQLLDGDWTARRGGDKFHREWFDIVDAAPVDCVKLRYWDMASTEPKEGEDPDHTAGAVLGIDADGVIYIIDIRRMRGAPGAVEKLVRQTAELDGISVKIGMEQEPGSSGKTGIDYYSR